MSLNRGLIFYKNQPFFLDSAEGGLAATLRYVPDQQKYLGHTSFENLDLTLEGLSVTDLTLSLDFEFLENQLRVLSLLLDSDELEIRAEGNISDIQFWERELALLLRRDSGLEMKSSESRWGTKSQWDSTRAPNSFAPPREAL